MPSAVGVSDGPLFFSLWSCKGCFPYGNASGRGRLVARASAWAALFSPIQFLAHLELTTNEKLALFHRPSSQQSASSRTFSSASCFSVESRSLTGSATCLPSCQIPSRVGRGTPSISSTLNYEKGVSISPSAMDSPPEDEDALEPRLLRMYMSLQRRSRLLY